MFKLFILTVLCLFGSAETRAEARAETRAETSSVSKKTTVWWEADFQENGQCTWAEISPLSTAKKEMEYLICEGMVYIKGQLVDPPFRSQFLLFDHQKSPALILNFFLPKKIDKSCLTITGCSHDRDSFQNCYFELKINNRFAGEFEAVDGVISGVTSIEIPAGILSLGDNKIELIISNKGFPAYRLQKLSLCSISL